MLTGQQVYRFVPSALVDGKITAEYCPTADGGAGLGTRAGTEGDWVVFAMKG